MRKDILVILLFFLICAGCAVHCSSAQKAKQEDDVATCLAEAKAERSERDGFSLPQEVFEWCMRGRGYSSDCIKTKWESIKRELDW